MNLLILSQKILSFLSWNQNGAKETTGTQIHIFPKKPVHLEFPPIPPKDSDLKPQTFFNRHVNATDIFLGCYFLESIEIVCILILCKK